MTFLGVRVSRKLQPSTCKSILAHGACVYRHSASGAPGALALVLGTSLCTLTACESRWLAGQPPGFAVEVDVWDDAV